MNAFDALDTLLVKLAHEIVNALFGRTEDYSARMSAAFSLQLR